jgi:DNA-binding XRE family transcriptional regulator
VGVSHTTIIKIANDQATPSVQLCRDIAHAFGVTVEEVYRLAGIIDMPSPESLDVAGLLARLNEMTPELRAQSVTLLNLILDFRLRDAEGAAHAGRRRPARGAATSADDPAERRQQLRALWDALPSEDREEVYREIQALLQAERAAVSDLASGQ